MNNTLILIILLFTTSSYIDKRNQVLWNNNNAKTINTTHQQITKKVKFDNLENAFNNNLIVNQYYLDNNKKVDYSITFTKQTIGNIKITSGKIIACDGIVRYGNEPFKQEFPKGDFPIDLAIGKYSVNNDGRVGFARIRFSENKPIRWEMAIRNGQDISKLKDDEIFGYGVDSGTGSFMDVDGKKELETFLNPSDRKTYNSNFEVISKELYKSDTSTWGQTIWERNGKNVVIFSSGVGDGFYATYIGYDSKNQICRLVTDFDLIMN